MLEVSDGYKSAVVGDVREVFLKAVLEIIDPDIQYSNSPGSGEALFSKNSQLYDKNMVTDHKYATLEKNRWVLDGGFRLIPDNPQETTGEIGYVGNVLSNADGTFPGSPYAELKFSNVSILQACSIYFPNNDVDGIPVDFKVSVMSSGKEQYSETFTANGKTSVSLDGFEVFDPDAIRVYVTKWSLPSRRIRVAEIIPGVYEEWTDDTVASIDIQMRGNFACLAIPYGTCTLRMDNLDRRFEPRNRKGVFKSIEDRQGLPVSIGVKLPDGTVEYKKLGVFYQYSGGWKTSDNDMTMQWDLVDIIGLISDREYIPPSSLPTTLSGWIASLAAQLGDNFKNRWHVDPAYAGKPCTVKTADDVRGRKCGDVLRFVCMATGTWPRADAETGDLTAEPFWSQGSKMDLDNLEQYPVMKANDDLAILTFKLYDGAGTIYNVSGNATSSSKTLSIDNPFIHTQQEALTASRQILSQYGGIILETIGRGNPASEIGDVDTVWLDESNATTGRRMEQGFSITEGFLSSSRSVLLQADGSFLYENKRVFTSDGVFHTDAKTSKLRIIIAGGGSGSEPGEDGDFPSHFGQDSGEGQNGHDGNGGKIWSGVVNVNPNTDYRIQIGKGGKASPAFGTPGTIGGATTFGVYSSENGHVYPLGFSDIASGDSYGRTGVEKPVSYGDGAKGGKGGSAGAAHRETTYGPDGKPSGSRRVVDVKPGLGTSGKDGAAGVCVIYWEKVN